MSSRPLLAIISHTNHYGKIVGLELPFCFVGRIEKIKYLMVSLEEINNGYNDILVDANDTSKYFQVLRKF